MPAPSALERLLADYPSLLVGYSGGVDSALVAVAARRVLGRERLIAALAVSPSLSRGQHQQARTIAQQFDLPLVEVATDELSDPDYVANRPNRCYFCKHELWEKLTTVAHEHRMAVIADGTNADDLTEHRPGRAAASEYVVQSPLAEAGYTKARVRAEARAHGLPIWNAPAAPCLSSRITYGLSVSPSRLRQVEEAEAALRALGVRGDLRVRHRDVEARIEVATSELAALRRQRAEVARRLLALGFRRVTLDPAGYRRGSLLDGTARVPELLGERD